MLFPNDQTKQDALYTRISCNQQQMFGKFVADFQIETTQVQNLLAKHIPRRNSPKIWLQRLLPKEQIM